MFSFFYDDKFDYQTALIQTSFGAGFYFFNISQWVFTYQYLYAAIIIPVILSVESDEQKAKRN